jgi:UDP-N-acetyl-D-glucosamine dehydrogenase
MSLEEKIGARTATVGVVGMGYVGLPLALALAKTGFSVVGLDVSDERVEQINRGESYIPDAPGPELAEMVRAGRFKASTQYRDLALCDAIFISVPTPFTATKAPDLSYVESAARSIAGHLQRGQLIVLQSTTHPGTTEEVVRPILESSGLKAGEHFHLAFSPERLNPGDAQNTVENTPRVVGGITPESTELARLLLSALNPQVYPVSTPRVAEMSKLLENIFRAVNIALVNELSKLCERMSIDIWEVIEAASTKPFGFMPFYPGAGVGGHCIPVDPYYLSWKAKEYDFYTKFIELAAEVNQSMPYHVVNLVRAALNRNSKPLKGSQVLVLGVAFKRDIDDPRNSPAIRVIELLLDGGADVCYHDPHVPSFSVGKDVFYPDNPTLDSVPLDDEAIAKADCVVIVTGHSHLDYGQIIEKAKVVVDSCNATKGVQDRAKVLLVGAPMT